MKKKKKTEEKKKKQSRRKEEEKEKRRKKKRKRIATKIRILVVMQNLYRLSTSLMQAENLVVNSY